MGPHETMTVTEGDGWKQYVAPRDVRLAATPLGTVSVGSRLEGALMLDLIAGGYRLLDREGIWHALDYTQVRAAFAQALSDSLAPSSCGVFASQHRRYRR